MNMKKVHFQALNSSFLPYRPSLFQYLWSLRGHFIVILVGIPPPALAWIWMNTKLIWQIFSSRDVHGVFQGQSWIHTWDFKIRIRIMAFPDPVNSKKRKLQKNDQVGQNLKNLFYLDQLHKKIVEKWTSPN